MFLVLIGLRLVTPNFFAHSQTAGLLWKYQPWLWTYTANLWMFFHSGMVVIGHFWSLCVEEQFYLIWPLVIFLIARHRVAIRACWVVIITAVMVGVGLQLSGVSSGRLWLFTPVRMDDLAAGALIALLMRDVIWQDKLSRLGPKFLAVGLGLWIISDGMQNLLRRVFHVAKSSNKLAQVVAFNLIPNFRTAVDVFIFVSLLLLALFPSALFGLPGKIYRMGWLRWLGRYSYGIYVYHFPIWVFCVMYLQSRGMFAKCCHNLLLACILVGMNLAIALSLSYASYHLYEKHFLKLKKYFPERAAALPRQ
jgi:peptidoglycan/LPS O-acetylase OafA/YrhL